MKHVLFLSDFLLLQSSLNEKLVDKCVGLSIDLSDDPDDYVSRSLEFAESLNELINTMDTTGVGFNDSKHKYKSVLQYVKMMADVYRGTQNYSITQKNN